jgi:hypothetical protein
MVKIDMGAPVPGQAPEGVYLAEVKSAVPKASKSSGEMMLEMVYLCRHESDAFEVRDYIMLGGKGWGMGHAKLCALGIPKDFEGDLDPTDLIGKRVHLHLVEEEYTNQRTGRTSKNLRPDAGAGTHAGYSPEDDQEAKEAPAVAEPDSTPF